MRIYFFRTVKKQYLFLLFALPLLFSGCLKKDIEPLTTDLQIQVGYRTQYYGYYDSIQVAPNVKVVLYKSKADMEARQRPVQTGYTNTGGFVTFKNLEPFAYFIHASYDDGTRFYDNSRNNNSLGDVLGEGALTSITIPITYQRVSNPTTVQCDFITVLNYKSYISSCSKELRFKIGNYSGVTRYDSTVYSDKYLYAPYNYYDFSFCKADRIATFYFAKRYSFPANVSAYYYVHVGEDPSEPGDVFNYSLAYTGEYPAYFTPYQYQKNNSYGNPEYPTRIRLWESADKTIDVNVIWQ